MDADSRRSQILARIAGSSRPVSGGELASETGVSRQVVVADVATLRARGHPILATPGGYLLVDRGPRSGAVRVFACRHTTLDETLEELMIMVEAGGRVRDVIIDHPVYGEISGQLRLSTPQSVRRMVERLSGKDASPLSAITGGRHFHTVEADDEAVLDRIQGRLRAAGLLEELPEAHGTTTQEEEGDTP